MFTSNGKGVEIMENKNNNTLIKFIVVLGSLAAIFLAAALIYKKYNKRLAKNSDPFEFDDDFFFDDCEGCYDESFNPDDTLNAATEDGEEEDIAF